MAELTKKIKLDFTQQGIEEIKKSMEGIKPVLGDSKEAQKLFQSLEVEMARLMQIGSEAGFELGSEAAKQFKTDYFSILKDFQKLREFVAAPLDPELKRQRAEVDTLINATQAQQEILREELDKIQQKYQTNQEGQIEASKRLQKEIFSAQMAGEKFLNSLGTDAASFDSWHAGMVRFNRALDEAVAKGEISSKNVSKLNEEEFKRLEPFLKKEKIRFDLQKSISQQLLYQKFIKKETKQVQDAVNKSKELETTLTDNQVALDAQRLRQSKIELKIQEDIQKTSNTTASDLGVKITQTTTALKDQANKAFEKYNEELKKTKRSTKEVSDETKGMGSTFNQAAKNVFSYGIAFTALRRIYRETLRTVTDLDKALTEMAIVTTMSRKETQLLVGTFQNLAKETGFTTTEIAKLSTVYFRQGRSLRDVIELTTIAAKAARIAGIDAVKSANLLTAAVNGFGLAAKEAEAVSDKFAALAASSASSYEELAVGLSKFASQAKVAGLSLDFAMGLLAKGVETTREAPESIGTALKTILARMRELTDLGKTLEDGMDVSRVDTALRQIGVNLRDTNGQFRDMENVLTEVGQKFSSLNKMQQASVAVALAGTRQQSRLLAIFQDFDRTLELVETSEESSGATMAQHIEFMKGMEASLTNLRTSWQTFITTITESEVVIGLVRTLSGAIDLLSSALNGVGLTGKNAMIVFGGLAGALKAYSIASKIAEKDTTLGIFLSEVLGKIKNREEIQLAKTNALKAKEIALQSLDNKISTQENEIATANIMLSEANISLEEKEFLIGVKNTAQKEIENLTDQKANLTKKESIALKLKNIIVGKLVALGLIKQTAAQNLETAATKKGAIAKSILTKKVWAFNKSMLASPLGPIILVMGALVLLFTALTKGAEDAKNETNSFAAELYKGVQAVFSVLKIFWDALVGIFKVLKPIIIALLVVGFAPLLFVIAKIAASFLIFTTVLRVINVGIQAFVKFVKDLLSKIPGFEKLEAAFKGIGNFFKNIGKEVGKVIKSFDEWEESVLDTTRSYEDLNKEIQDSINKNIAENYELGRKVKTVKSLSKEWENLGGSTRIRTDEDLAAIDDLEKRIIDFLGEDKVKELGLRDSFGSLDIDEAIQVMNSQIEENQKTMLNNLRENATNTLRLIRNDAEKFYGDPKNMSILSAYLMGQLEAEGTDLTAEQKRAIAIANKNIIQEVETQRRLSEATTDEQRETILQDIFGRAQDYLKVSDGLSKIIEDSSGKVLDKTGLFNEALASLGSDETAIKTLKETFPELAFLSEKFGDRINDIKIQNLFDELGFDEKMFNTIGKALDKTGTSMEDFFSTVADEQDKLMKDGMDPALAFAQAWGIASMKVGDNIEDATERAAVRMNLLNIAIKQTSLDSAQSLDFLTSKLERLNKVQEDFAKGTMSFQDLLRFLEEFDLTEEQIQDFLSGKDMGRVLREEAQEARKQLLKTNEVLQAQLNAISDQNSEEAKGLRAQIARNQLLYDYGNELKRVTKNQYEYNLALERQNRLSKLGIENDEMRLEVFQATLNLTVEKFAESNQKIQGFTEELVEDLGENWEDYIDVVGGVVVLNYNLLEQHGKEIRNGLIDSYQEALDENLNFYEQLMKQSLDREKKLADGRKKVYEDYFDALDRLEEKRERKLTREQLVQQLQRLEGATDERSRQRAKDLRAELIKLDQDAAKKTQEEARKDLLKAIDDSLENLTKEWQDIFTNLISSGGLAGIEFLEALESAGIIPEGSAEEARNSIQNSSAPGYKEGGLVNFTGPAMVHGTKTKPEAFLNSEQTEMFSNLRDSLSKAEFEPSNISETVSIGNITISTQSMNNNQDFKKAGQVLAEAFNSAINRRGISVNTKR